MGTGGLGRSAAQGVLHVKSRHSPQGPAPTTNTAVATFCLWPFSGHHHHPCPRPHPLLHTEENVAPRPSLLPQHPAVPTKASSGPLALCSWEALTRWSEAHRGNHHPILEPWFLPTHLWGP